MAFPLQPFRGLFLRPQDHLKTISDALQRDELRFRGPLRIRLKSSEQ